MRLGIISNVRGCAWAGSETVWQQAALRALQDGHSVTAVLHHDLMAAREITEFCEAGGSVRNWQPFPIARLRNAKEKIAPTFPPRLLRQFDAVLISLGSLPAVNYVPGLVEGLLNAATPYVLFCQFNSDHLLITPNERSAVTRLIKKSAACVFVSHRNLAEARRQFATEPPNAKVVLNSVRSVLQSAWPWPDNGQSVSFASVARFETAWKGQDLLLDVLSQPRWRERNWRLRFYGAGPDLEFVRRLADFLSLDDRVTFEGFVEGLSSIWSGNHVLLMPSHGEGTPLAALEAMMYGRPVVATDVGGISEIIRDGETGFIAEAATASSFSNALERAWDAQSKWREMGLAAHKSVFDRSVEDPTKALLKSWTAAAART